MSLSISLHPLVIINITDHYTRQFIRSEGKVTRVYGALFGSQEGRTVEILNSCELLFESSSLDIGYFAEKETQMKTVFPKYEVLGWYSTGAQIQPNDMMLNKQVLQLNESPLYLMLDPHVGIDKGKDLPISIYETELRMEKEAPVHAFSKASFKIETIQAERIAVDHIAHATSGSESALVAQLSGMHNAINMLSLRINAILQFLQATKNGKVAPDHNLLRKIATMTQLLPTMDSPSFNEGFLKEYNDTLLVVYMSTITKGTNNLNELIDKFSMSHEMKGMGGMGGIGGARFLHGMGGMGGMGGMMGLMGLGGLGSFMNM
jgi:COP9 signalosome complex subunit 6